MKPLTLLSNLLIQSSLITTTSIGSNDHRKVMILDTIEYLRLRDGLNASEDLILHMPDDLLQDEESEDYSISE